LFYPFRFYLKII